MRESLLRSSQALKSWYMAVFQLPVLPERALSKTLALRLERGGLPAAAAQAYAAGHGRSRHPDRSAELVSRVAVLPAHADRTITVPTTYVWGRHDFALGRVAAERTAAHVSADYRFLDLDAGHWLPESNPSEVADAIIDRRRGS